LGDENPSPLGEIGFIVSVEISATTSPDEHLLLRAARDWSSVKCVRT